MISSIKQHYEIRFKDVDIENGDTVCDEALAISMELSNANWIRHALEKDWIDEHNASTPNRKFYIVEQKEITL